MSPTESPAGNEFEIGFAAGMAGEPRPGITPLRVQGWVVGAVERRVKAGEAVALGGPGSKGLKC